MVKEETLKELALSRSEYNLILDKLDREPNDLELGLFGALWSEHCGYKHTKKLLRFQFLMVRVTIKLIKTL